MRKETKEIVKLTAKEILLTLFDIPMMGVSVFDARGYYKKSINEYLEERSFDRSNFRQKIYYLKKMGFINNYLEGQESFVELTPKGFENINLSKFKGISIQRNQNWDGRFRIIVWDIPSDKKYLGDALRRKLIKIGFRQIQKSIFAFPFECKKEIDQICYFYGVRRYLKYMIADILEGEDEIISFFLDTGILQLSDLDLKSKSDNSQA